MTIKHEFKNGVRHLFVEPETDEEQQFLIDFFNSDDEVTVQFPKDSAFKRPRLIFGKAY